MIGNGANDTARKSVVLPAYLELSNDVVSLAVVVRLMESRLRSKIS